MLTIFPHQAHSITDLAANLTDPALELLEKAGTRGDSVAMELELWHVLTFELKRELCERRASPRDSALNQVVRRAALRVAGERSQSSQYRNLRTERAVDRLTRV